MPTQVTIPPDTILTSLTIPDTHFDRFDIVDAHYWYCTDYHSGQSSDEYATLSRLGKFFRPSRSARCPDTENGRAIYRCLVQKNHPKDLRIEFQEILDSCIVEKDDECDDKPWGSWREYLFTVKVPPFSESVKYRENPGYCYSQIHNTFVLIRLSENRGQDYDNWRYYHRKGMSKQKARECIAFMKQKYIEQLVHWHSHGWSWFEVSGSYTPQNHDHPPGEEISAGRGGIDSFEYAFHEERIEAALEMSEELEDQGYVVVGKPVKNIRYDRQYDLKIGVMSDCPVSVMEWPHRYDHKKAYLFPVETQES